MRLLFKTAGHLCRQSLRVHQAIRCSHSTLLNGKVDRYNGITINIPECIPASTPMKDFSKILTDAVACWKAEGRIAIWLQVPIHYSRFIEAASEEGFVFHHAENNECLLKLWLGSREDSTPRFATHQVGVCGVVLREDTEELLVMQEKKSQFSHWKFPGGLADLGEDIGDAAVRETFEETGIRANFNSVLAIRQQHDHPSAFGRSDLYVVCRLLPVTFDIVPCGHEVLQCRWMHIEELYKHVKITSITHRIVTLMMQGLRHGFDTVDITAEEMESVYKGLKYHLYHRPLAKDFR